MLENILKYSGFDIEKTEYNIIVSELYDMINELKVLSEFNANNNPTNQNTLHINKLRTDKIKPSFDKQEILSNAKNKNEDGILVNKII